MPILGVCWFAKVGVAKELQPIGRFEVACKEIHRVLERRTLAEITVKNCSLRFNSMLMSFT